jgi:hypothetical protein
MKHLISNSVKAKRWGAGKRELNLILKIFFYFTLISKNNNNNNHDFCVTLLIARYVLSSF